MQLIAAGYGEPYEMVHGKTLDQQPVSLFPRNETILGMPGTLFIVGIAIPFYEKVLLRTGFPLRGQALRQRHKKAASISLIARLSRI